MKMTINDITPHKSQHYFTRGYSNSNLNENWHCPYCSFESFYNQVVDHVCLQHQDKIIDFIHLIKK